MSVRRSRAWWPVVAALVFIAAMTLVPARGDVWRRDFWCLRCGDSLDPVEAALNVLLFVPLGLALRRAGVRAGPALAAVLSATVAIEALQYFLIVGRDGSLRDCLSNTVGGLAAYAVRAEGGVAPRTFRRLAWAATAIWIAHAAAAVLLFRPDTTSYRYFGQVAPRLGQFDAFEGAVAGSMVNGVALPDGLMSPELEASVRAGGDSIRLAALVGPAPATRRVAPILAVVDGGANEIAILAQMGTSVVFEARVVAHRFGLYSPAVVLPNALGAAARRPRASPIVLVGARRGPALHAAATYANGERASETLTLSPSLGWALWWPMVFPGATTVRWMTVAWLVLPMALIAFWSAAGRPTPGRAADGVALRMRASVRAMLPIVIAMLGSHLAVPFLLRAVPGGWMDWFLLAAGAALGVAAGWLRSPAGDVTLGA